MTAIRDAYLEAAASAVALLREPAVAAAWDQPSALKEFSGANWRNPGRSPAGRKPICGAGWSPGSAHTSRMMYMVGLAV